MRIRSMVLLSVAAAAMALPVAAGAGHDTCHSTPVSVGGVIYVDDRPATGEVVSGGGANGGHGTWLYLETNGVAGLQRGGSSILLGDIDRENCNQSANPDSLLV